MRVKMLVGGQQTDMVYPRSGDGPGERLDKGVERGVTSVFSFCTSGLE